MSRYRGPSEPTRSEETEGEWVDFPASPDPDPWATLFRKANRLPPDVDETQGGNASFPRQTPMITRRPFNQLAITDHRLLTARHHFSFADDWDAKRIGGAVMTSLVIGLRGLLVTATTVAIVAFLLLTNSHI
jgi:hypothetical protein